MAAAGGLTIGEALNEAASTLAEAAIAEPRREARLLLAASLGSEVTIVLAYPERLVPAPAADRFFAWVARRADGEPAARLLGRKEFWGLDFALSPATLVPRPDSETVIEAALAAIPDRGAPLRIVDFGTGTGCLLLALLSELPAAFGVGIDLAEGAANTARANAVALGFDSRAAFLVGCWAEALNGPFDIALANPPYVRAREISELAPEVALHDPRLALDGGADGLDAYRALAPQLRRLLRAGGSAFLELGIGQSAAVTAIMRAAGLAEPELRHDLSGIERCLWVRRATRF
jgi:release factor glutamine methyltransferase